MTAWDTARDIVGQRLRNQRLAGPPLASPAEAARWLVAAQAQEYPVAKWTLGMRAADATERAVDQALADGAVLRTHVLRPTWHFVHAHDLRWLLALTAPRVHAANAA